MEWSRFARSYGQKSMSSNPKQGGETSMSLLMDADPR